ncbi:TauD/TfdA family dioxygenase [Alphaproteobacteria bacterium]|nr:TauD/TfdA family dioxygenase [Alphaproteobacteria bacterium]
MKITPLSGTIGAEIEGINLAEPLAPIAVKRIRKAFLDNQVLVFPNQELTPKQHLAFARKFGTADIYPFLKGIDGVPQVIEILKAEKDTSNFGKHWHSDTTYMPKPNMGTMLYALEVPNPGGDTMFADMYRAYDTLSNGMKKLLKGVTGLYSSAQNNIGGRAEKMKALAGMKTAFVGEADPIEAIHPVIRTHPETGKKALYVNFSHTVHFNGMTREETLPILEHLTRHAVKPEFTCRVRWRKGDLVFWDNRCVQHKAINDYDGQRRRMHRVTLKGDKPY